MSGFFMLYLPFLIDSLVCPILVANNTQLYVKMKKSWLLNEEKLNFGTTKKIFIQCLLTQAEVWLNPAESQANMFLKL